MTRRIDRNGTAIAMLVCKYVESLQCHIRTLM